MQECIQLLNKSMKSSYIWLPVKKLEHFINVQHVTNAHISHVIDIYALGYNVII